ncbi:MAG: NADH oxidoreductase (quinone) subunit F [Deltaproteobacteria bacterium]|nr:MAG: NADH oxidoreductase (quinone) subunit F [Deltaproteobacteria bacterium]
MDVPKPRILTRRWGLEGSHTLAVARKHGAYESLRKALTMEPSAITQVVKDSGLRGRGGAGFPTGVKWGFVPPPEKRGDKPVYLICNADESEPGTFKDRYCIWNDPHALIEGCLIAAWAIGAKTAYIYLRGEFKFVKDRLDAALAEAREAGLVGRNILGTGIDIDVWTHLGAGAYICGEETALLSSLEGGRGQPKLKPPFPAVEGAWRCPTIVNNVETLQVVPWLIEHGAAAYRAIGTEKSPGTKLFSCSGHIRRPGVYELPLGYPMIELLNDECGGLHDGRTLKAVIPGGSSVPVMTPDEVARATMDYESINEVAGSYLGSGGFIVMDDRTDLVAALANLLRFYAHESCGQCSPCREGTGWMHSILQRLAAGEATEFDIATLRDVANNIHSRTICFFGASAAMPVQSFLKKFPEEFFGRAGVDVPDDWQPRAASAK